MKKLNSLLLLGAFCISTMVSAGSPDYVATADGVDYFKKIRYGFKSVIIGIKESGRVRYDKGEVIAFRKDGHVFERVPVIVNNTDTGKYAFMELVAYRNGFKLYRHSHYTGINTPTAYEYFVFKDGCYHVSFDEKNFLSLSEFFFRKEYLIPNSYKVIL